MIKNTFIDKSSKTSDSVLDELNDIQTLNYSLDKKVELLMNLFDY